MGLDNPIHLLILLAILLLVFGAKRLPEMGARSATACAGSRTPSAPRHPPSPNSCPPRPLWRRRPRRPPRTGRHRAMQVTAVLRTALRSVPDDAHLSVVDHLDELRTRMIVSLTVIAVAFGICFTQNQRLLDLIDAPLAHVTQNAVRAGDGPLGATYTVQKGARDIAVQVRRAITILAPRGLPPASRTALAGSAIALGRHSPPVGGSTSRSPRHARDRRAVHDDGDRDAHLRTDPVAPGSAPTGVWIPDAGTRQRTAPPDATGADRRPRAVHHRRRIRVLHRPSGRRPLPPDLQRRPVQRPRAGRPVSRFAAPSYSRWARSFRCPSRSSRPPGQASSRLASCAGTAGGRLRHAPRSGRSSPATRSRCCSRRFRCTSCSS